MSRGFGALGIFVLTSLVIVAQETNSGLVPAAIETAAAKPFSLQPPAPKSPVDMFRTLLAMSAIDQREFIAKKPPELQKVIWDKVHEYERLIPDQRELRLRVTELRWYLRPLLNASADQRTARLAAIPDELRSLVETRLEEWNKLTPESQRGLLENESAIRFFFELAARPAAEQAQTVTNLASQGPLEAGIRHWQSLSDEQREEMVNHFKQFFDLTPGEKTKALNTLSEPERLQIEKTLHTFAGLSPAQRSKCLQSFQKFVGLSPEDRVQFLKSAERWQRMTPTERQSWRNLVSTLSHQPPLPPGFRTPQAPPPPSPLLVHPAHGPKSVVTQTN